MKKMKRIEDMMLGFVCQVQLINHPLFKKEGEKYLNIIHKWGSLPQHQTYYHLQQND